MKEEEESDKNFLNIFDRFNTHQNVLKHPPIIRSFPYNPFPLSSIHKSTSKLSHRPRNHNQVHAISYLISHSLSPLYHGGKVIEIVSEELIITATFSSPFPSKVMCMIDARHYIHFNLTNANEHCQFDQKTMTCKFVWDGLAYGHHTVAVYHLSNGKVEMVENSPHAVEIVKDPLRKVARRIVHTERNEGSLVGIYYTTLNQPDTYIEHQVFY